MRESTLPSLDPVDVCRDDSTQSSILRARARRRGPSVLLIDEDESTRQAFSTALRLNGFDVVAARAALGAMSTIDDGGVDLIVINPRLGSELGAARSFSHGGRRFVPLCGFLAVDEEAGTLTAGRIGAEPPVTAGGTSALVTSLSAALEACHRSTAVDGSRATRGAAPRCAAERWVQYVLKACDAESDLKTLESWAQQAAVSYTTLCANCRIMRIRPLDARDFMRVLRSLKLASSQRHRCPPEVFLDVSDARTVRTLSMRAGVDLDARAGRTSIQEFLARQQFVPTGNQGLRLIHDVVSRWQIPAAAIPSAAPRPDYSSSPATRGPDTPPLRMRRGRAPRSHSC